MKTKYFYTIFLVGIICLLFSHYANAVCQNTDNSPTSCGSYKNEWSNPTNAYTQNDVTSRAVSGATTDEEDYYTFSFSILTGATILGIRVESDLYGGTGSQMNCSLSWDGGTSWTTTKVISGFTTSDTDTYYSCGGLTDTWGRTWAVSEFSNSNFRLLCKQYNPTTGRSINIDHIRIDIDYTVYPSEVSEFKYYIKPTNCTYINLTYQMNSYTEQVTIRYDTDTYPINTGDGTFLYFGSLNPYSTNTFTMGTTYYLSIWGYNNSCSENSLTYDTLYLVTACNPYLTVYNNTQYTTGKYQTSYNKVLGNKIWLNYTGILPTFNHYENIENATGTHEHNSNNGGHTINIWANYTGNASSVICPDIIFFNFSDENITISGFVNCSTEVNNTNYTINEDNWINIMGLSLESGELGLLLVFFIFSLAFYVDSSSNKKNIWKPILLFMDVPISFATGVYYIGFTANSIEFWIGMFMFLFAVLLSFGGIYYSMNFGNKG